MYSAIGKRIKALRRNKNMTQAEFAEKCEISLSFLGHIERGTRKLSVDTLYRITKTLPCSADELLGIDASSDSSAISDEITAIITELQALKKRFN